MEPKQISDMFLNEYYKVMQLNREQRQALINFYQECSRMTYTGTEHAGLKQIAEKIESFAFEAIQYANMSSDVQQGPIPGSIVVFVVGHLCMDGNEAEQFRFAQTFNILPNGNGGFYIHNDIFSIIQWMLWSRPKIPIS